MLDGTAIEGAPAALLKLTRSVSHLGTPDLELARNWPRTSMK